ncbi:S8 family serine peptidase [Streptomyces sp. NBC_01387]|uniref:S8 family serine peptidase n=1 Tax=unclassified Streptomyces TaxID=2593676 RepID=UPI002E37DB19|nr:S8 family serine peptidase [Streptomyces sp. NBC_01267]
MPPRTALLPAAALALLVSVSAASPAEAADSPSLPSVSAGPPSEGGCVKPSKKHSDLTPWPQRLIAPSRAWPSSRGAGVTVAVVDTGVDEAPALAGRVKAGPDVVSGGTAGKDCIGHGTFVAGVVAAGQKSGVGFAGVAPDARILAIGVTGKDGSATADKVAAGIRAAVSGGARVVDVPIALNRGSASLTSAVQEAVRKNVLVVAPAYGITDSSGSPAPAAYPAALPGVLAVAGLAPGGGPDQKAAPATAPDIAAPGTSLMSIGPGGTGHFSGSGADLATGFVAGTAALVDGYRPGLTVQQLTDRLTSTAYPSPGLRALTGAGTVDPAGAVTAVLPSSAPRPAKPAPAPQLAASTGDSAHAGAVAVAGGAAGIVALTAFFAVVLPRARRRGWRAGV